MRLRVALLFAGVLLIGGCEAGRLDGIVVQNETDIELHFAVIRPDGTVYDIVDRAPPGGTAIVIGPSDTGLIRDRCTVGDLIALDPKGVEVARRAPPICINERWVIPGPGATASPAST